MFNFLKGIFPRKIIGVDIGTFSIKIIEISQWGRFKKLKNYSEVPLKSIIKEPLLEQKGGGTFISPGTLSLALREGLDEAGIKTKAVIFSIPDFLTFSTSFEIPPMPEKEIAGAIQYNAAQYVTLPISEVTVDWRIIPNNSSSKILTKVLIVAIPNQVVQDYKTIAKEARLELYAIEPEIFGLNRAFTQKSQKVVCLVDIGMQSSTVNIIDKGFLKKSYSITPNTKQLTQELSSVLGFNEQQVEEIKSKEGFNSSNQAMRNSLLSFADSLMKEIKGIVDEFYRFEQKMVDEVYLTGGTANMPGLKGHIGQGIGKPIFVPYCFSELLYPKILKGALQEINPRFSVAVGVALDGLEI